MENQRPLLFMTLFFLGFLIWQAWVADHAPPPVENPETVAASETAAETYDRNDLPDAENIVSEKKDITIVANPSSAAETIHIKTDVLDVTISTQGGDILEVKLPSYPVSLEQQDTPLTLLTTDPARYIAQSGLLHDKQAGEEKSHRAPNHYAHFASEQSEFTLQPGAERLEVPLTWQNDEGVRIEKIYIFYPGEFHVDVEYRIQNASDTDWVGRKYRQLRRAIPEDEKKGSMLMGTAAYVGTAYFDGKYEKLKFKDIAEEKLNKEIMGGWVSMVQHYFISAWIPESQEDPEKVYAKQIDTVAGPEYLIGLRSAAHTIPAGESGSIRSRFYAGPKLYEKVSELAPALELTSDYGIFTVIASPIFWLLRKIYSVVGNWGWAIIFLTLIIKLLFYKLSETSYRSMANMRKLTPKLKALKDRIGDDKQKYQQAMMELYKKEKINPMGGCLPILIQIPVFISLYWVLLEAVELRQAPWMLWIKDLSIKDPYFVLPLLMGATMFIQQKLNPPPPDPMQAKIFMALPFVFTVFFAFFPAGLVLYWFVNSLLSISQQWVITRRIEKAAKN